MKLLYVCMYMLHTENSQCLFTQIICYALVICLPRTFLKLMQYKNCWAGCQNLEKSLRNLQVKLKDLFICDTIMVAIEHQKPEELVRNRKHEIALY